MVSGRILNGLSARIIRDSKVIFTSKIASIFREKDQVKEVVEGQECGITLKDYNDFQKKDIIEIFESKVKERSI